MRVQYYRFVHTKQGEVCGFATRTVSDVSEKAFVCT